MAKILLAEDDLFLRDVYTETIRGEGYDISVATDGEEALQKITSGGWDLVLLDNIMPKMTGIEILEKIKNNKPHTLAKHIVFMTNSEESKSLDEVSGVFDDYILKSSITPGQLLEKVKVYLKK